MKKKTSAITIGIDLGIERSEMDRSERDAPHRACDRMGASNRKHAVCVLDAKGEVLKQESITNTRTSLTALSRRYPAALIVMEVGMHSPWTCRFLEGRLPLF